MVSGRSPCHGCVAVGVAAIIRRMSAPPPFDPARVQQLATEALQIEADAGARFIGEFSLGFNPHILHPIRDILFDEKIAGSFHFTPGQAYEVGGNGNRSQIHWDMVCIQRPDYGGGEVWFDGKLVRRDGVFTLPELKTLNPATSK